MANALAGLETRVTNLEIRADKKNKKHLDKKFNKGNKKGAK